jgi:hypothetical protein
MTLLLCAVALSEAAYERYAALPVAKLAVRIAVRIPVVKSILMPPVP